jgi:hypothetical protein
MASAGSGEDIMRGPFGFLVLAIVLILSGCGSDDTITGEDPIADLDDLRVELECLGPGTADVNCYMPDVDEESSTIDGEAGTTYDVTIRLRGVVEQKTYTGYTDSDGMWIEGGTPDGGSFNIFSLHISSPAKTYYLNSGASGYDECFLLDIQKTIVMDDGAALTLLADAGGDSFGTINMDADEEPIVVTGVAPYPYAFNGQFVQLDIIDIVVH